MFLVAHGLSAMSVFGETVGVRLMVGSLAVTLASAVAFAVSSPAASGLPNATLWGIVLLVLSFQALVASLFFVFGILASRSVTGFLPIRDHRFFVLRERILREAP